MAHSRITSINSRRISALYLFALISLSLLILVYPTREAFQYAEVQSVMLIPNITIFGVIFTAWEGLVILGIFATKSRYPRFLISLIYGFVCLSFWAVRDPLGKIWEEYFSMAHIQYLASFHQIPFANPNLFYFQFPGLYLLGYGLNAITSMPILMTRYEFLLAYSIMMPMMLFMLFERILRDSKLAAISVVLFVQADWALARTSYFYPESLGYLLFLTAILFVVGTVRRRSVSLISFTISAFALAITNLPNDFALVIILFSASMFSLVVMRDSHLVSTAIISILFTLSWVVFSAYLTFGEYFGPILRELQLNPQGVFLNLFVNANFGQPGFLWAEVIRYASIAMILVVPFLLTLGLLLRRSWSLLLGFVIGIFVISAGTLLTPGTSQYLRILEFSPFFTVPFLVSRLDKKVVLLALVVFLIFSSVPSFLSNNDSVAIERIYPFETAVGTFIQTLGVQRPNVVSDGLTDDFLVYYTPAAHFVVISTPYTNLAVSELMSNVYGFKSGTNSTLFILGPWLVATYQKYYGISPKSVVWTNAVGNLTQTNMIYSNGNETVFQSLQRG
jgi:hypothetical protein